MIWKISLLKTDLLKLEQSSDREHRYEHIRTILKHSQNMYHTIEALVNKKNSERKWNVEALQLEIS